MTESHACPRDGAGLKHSVAGAAELWSCPRCHGLWVGRADLEAVLHSPYEKWKLPPSEPSPRGAEPIDHTLTCLCHAVYPMRTVSRGEVRIDLCPECGGVWLDGGELERLMRHHDPKELTEGTGSRLGEALALEALLELLTEVFDIT